MCIAIYKPSEKILDKDTLYNCFLRNSDGCGFAYINEDHHGHKKIIVKKAMEFDKFWKQYQRATRVAPESPFIIHFRISTHGIVTTFNCHPFMIDRETVFAHNGVIHGVPADKKKSDTQMFNDVVLKDLPKGWMKIAAIKTLLEDFIGHSKLIVMDLDGNYNIYNEHKGIWNDGVWYSNDSYEDPFDYNIGYGYGYSERKTWRSGSRYGKGYDRYGKVIGRKAEEKKEEKEEKKKEEAVETTETTQVKCDRCGKVDMVGLCSFYYYFGSPVVICDDCDMLPINRNSYENTIEISMKCFLDFANSAPEDEYDNIPEQLEKWDNPWAGNDTQAVITYDEQKVQEFLDYEEAAEAAYQEAVGSFH